MNLNSEIKAGVAIRAKYTETNRNCGIDPNSARGYICKADGQGVSIYLDKKSGGGWIEGMMTAEDFAMNFEIDGYMLTAASAYVRSSHYPKRFPDSFL